MEAAKETKFGTRVT